MCRYFATISVAILLSVPLVAGITPFPTGFHTQMVPTNGTSLYVRVGGKGPAVVLDETGGEAYYIGFSGTPVSFIPFLEDVGKRLTHQYLLTFLARPSKKANWHRIRLMTEVPNADLVGPGKVWVAP